jgi:hypothetical protein
MKSYQAAINKVMWRQIHVGALSVLLNIMINLNITFRCREFLNSLNVLQSLALFVGFFVLNGGVYWLVRRFLRARHNEELQRRLYRLQVWEIVKADRNRKEHEKTIFGRQDV